MANSFFNKFQDEFSQDEKNKDVDVKYAYNVFQEKVKPYLTLITRFRNGEKRLSMEQIRLALGVSHSMWDRFRRMPMMIEFLDSEKDLMTAKVLMDIVRAVNLKPENAVAVKLQAERFDPFYQDNAEKLSKIPTKVVFEVSEGKQSDEEIQARTDIDIDD